MNVIAARRLENQCITRARRGGPAEIVSWLGAVQAQEYPHAKWALGLRMRDGATDAEVERAFHDGAILRTHVLRPTWHFVTPADIRWMLELTAPRIHRAMASYNRKLELDAITLNRAIHVIENALQGNRNLTRAELAAQLERAGLIATGQRLAHLVMHAELEGVICSGPRRGKQFTYALLAERAPAARRLPREEALSELTLRFFRSHGPATIRDFNWWSGLPAADIKRGLEMNRARPVDVEGRTYWTIGRGSRGSASAAAGVHLLPIYDEYLVAYRDREAVPHAPTVIFLHPFVIDGQVAGTWKPAGDADGARIEIAAMRRLSAAERRGVEDAAARYGRFLG